MNREDMIESVIEILISKGINAKSAYNRASRMNNRMLEKIIEEE